MLFGSYQISLVLIGMRPSSSTISFAAFITKYYFYLPWALIAHFRAKGRCRLVDALYSMPLRLWVVTGYTINYFEIIEAHFYLIKLYY